MDPLPLLRDLVAVNSVNPSLVRGAPGEAQAAEVCRHALTAAGLELITVGVPHPLEPNPAQS